MLNKWFRDLDNPAPPPKSEKVTRSLEGLQKYFTDLNQALREISTDPPKPYIDRLCSVKNSYDFARMLEKIVEEVLYSEGKMDLATRKAYYLYYFHREQLEKAASDKLFFFSKQIGRIWT